MRLGWRLCVLVVACSLLHGGCRGSEEVPLVLDGRPRVADTAGVVEAIDGRTIRLRDGRSFVAVDGFRSFSTYTLALEPMRNRIGEYVQLGVDEDEALWMAGFGEILIEDPPTVVYTGRLVRLQDRRAIFRDGTVLLVARGVDLPSPGEGVLQAEIDTRRHEVVRLTPA